MYQNIEHSRASVRPISGANQAELVLINVLRLLTWGFLLFNFLNDKDFKNTHDFDIVDEERMAGFILVGTLINLLVNLIKESNYCSLPLKQELYNQFQDPKKIQDLIQLDDTNPFNATVFYPPTVYKLQLAYANAPTLENIQIGVIYLYHSPIYNELRYSYKNMRGVIEENSVNTSILGKEQTQHVIAMMKEESKDGVLNEQQYALIKQMIATRTGIDLAPVNTPQYGLQVSLTIGENQIHRHVQNMMNIIEDIEKSQPKYFQFTTKQSSLYKLLPYTSKNCDMPSKARVLEFLIYPGYICSTQMAATLGLSPLNAMFFTAGYTALTWLSSVRESYLLREIHHQMNLEGYSYKYPGYFSSTPTCVGQQLARKIGFYPFNETLKTTILDTYKNEQILKEIPTSPVFKQLPSDLQQRIKFFKPILKQFEVDKTVINPCIEQGLEPNNGNSQK
jgi:hypothetical protein